MNSRISVMTDIEVGRDEINNVLLQLVSFEEACAELRKLLDDTEKWDGDAHDSCSDLLGLIMSYEEVVYDTYEKLKKDLEKLISLAENFDFESYLVKSIKAW